MATETLIFLIVLFALIVGLLPSWPYSRSWGYGPSGVGVLICVVLLFWVFSNRGGSGNSNVGDDLKRLGQDVKHDVRKMADESSDAVKDMTR